MDKERPPLQLYRVIPKYIETLRDEEQGGDRRVYDGKISRPFIGVVTVCNGQKYCIPLTTPKKKFQKMKGRIDFGIIKIDGVIIGAIEYSRMIPVEEHLIRPLDIREHKHDTPLQKNKKQLRLSEYIWCQDHREEIVNKVNVLYNTYISGKPFKRKQDCLNFTELEQLCKKYCEKHPQKYKR